MIPSPGTRNLRNCDKAWERLWEILKLDEHDFNNGAFFITAKKIWSITKNFTFASRTALEPRLLAKFDTREERPEIFKKHGLFIMPVENGLYAIVKGEGYTDVPRIESEPIYFKPVIDFNIVGNEVGNSEMQHLDFAFANGIIQHFVGNEKIIYSIRGRKRGCEFSFSVKDYLLKSKSVQIEVDAGFEGKDEIYLFEAKNKNTENIITRQLYYPYKLWSNRGKNVRLFFFEKQEIIKKDNTPAMYCFWEYAVKDENDYNSLYLVKSAQYILVR